MKANLLISILFISISSVNSQMLVNQPKAGNGMQQKNQRNASGFKAGGDVIWAEDFEGEDWQASVDAATNLLSYQNLMPDGWKVFDGTGNSFFWHWSVLGPRGKYTGSQENEKGDSFFKGDCHIPNPLLKIKSATASNGFMMLESDYFNTDSECQIVNPQVQMDSYIMTPSLDFSSAPGIHLYWQQFFRYCCLPEVQYVVGVSTDYDENNPNLAHWHEFDAFFGSDPGTASENPQNVKIDLTSLVTNQSNVRIRWHQKGGTHYFWMIDDVVILEPYQFDLEIGNSFAYYLNLPEDNSHGLEINGGYNYIPKSQVGEYKSFKAIVSNIGVNTQYNVGFKLKVIKNNVFNSPLWEATSQVGNLNPGLQDTFLLQSRYFLPDKIGKYSFQFEAFSENDDYNPVDNLNAMDIWVTDSVYSRSKLDTACFISFSTDDIFGGDFEGAMLGVLYTLPVEGSLKSVGFYFHGNNDPVLVQEGKYKCKAHIYSSDSVNLISPEPLVSSELYTLKPADLGKFVSVSLPDPSGTVLPSGSYYIVLECYSGTPDGTNHVGFKIGSDSEVNPIQWDHFFPVNLIKTNNFGWGIIKRTPSVYLKLNDEATRLTKVNFMVDMMDAGYETVSFMHGRDSVLLVGSFNNYGQTKDYMTYKQGYYTTTKNIPYGDVFKWSFAFQTPDGQIYNEYYNDRVLVSNYSVVTIRSYFNHYFGDIIIGNRELVTQSVQIFPNPVRNFVNLTGLPVGCKIKLYDALGKFLFQEGNKDSFHSLDLSSLVSGIYFIEVQYGTEKPAMFKFMKL